MKDKRAARVAERHLDKRAGVLQAPPAMVEAIQEWAVSILAASYLPHADPRNQSKVKSFIKGPAKAMRKKAFRKFPLDLKGWRYEKKFRGQDPGPCKEVRVTLTISVGVEGAEAYYDSEPFPRIVLNVTNPLNIRGFDRFENEVFALSNYIRHEMQHFTQSLMAHYLNQAEIGDKEFSVPVAGMPSKGSMTPEFRQEFQYMGKSRKRQVKKVLEKAESLGIRWSMHSADDVEFYTLLADAIEKFKRGSSDMDDAEKRKWIMWYTVAKTRPKPEPGQRRRRKIRLRPPEELGRWTGYDSSDFFSVLKKTSPKKYRKALGEFVKAVL